MRRDVCPQCVRERCDPGVRAQRHAACNRRRPRRRQARRQRRAVHALVAAPDDAAEDDVPRARVGGVSDEPARRGRAAARDEAQPVRFDERSQRAVVRRVRMVRQPRGARGGAQLGRRELVGGGRRRRAANESVLRARTCVALERDSAHACGHAHSVPDERGRVRVRGSARGAAVHAVRRRQQRRCAAAGQAPHWRWRHDAQPRGGTQRRTRHGRRRGARSAGPRCTRNHDGGSALWAANSHSAGGASERGCVARAHARRTRHTRRQLGGAR